MVKIMIVEDEKIIRDLLALELTKHDFETFPTTDFARVLEDFEREDPKLVLLDIHLPVKDGYYWGRKIREISKVPIIYISSLNTNMDMLTAIELGADDYITKPFSMEILVMKITALLRRSYQYQESENILEYRGLKMNVETSSAVVFDEVVELSKNEYKLLYLLMKHQGKVMSREKLLKALWEDARFVDDNTLTVNINRLRKKIQQAGIDDFIETKVGKGYVIA